MKKNYLAIALSLFAVTFSIEKLAAQCAITLTSDSGSCTLPTTLRINADFAFQQIDWYYEGNLIQTYSNAWDSNGITVAATPLQGHMNDLVVDDSGNVYVTEYYQKRVSKWAPQATAGVVIAEITSGTFQPVGLALDKNNNIYIADNANNRVYKWSIGATSGTIIAGGNGAGAAANQFNGINSIYLDKDDNLFVVDNGNGRIQKWAAGATSGTTVASGLSNPKFLAFDKEGNMFVSQFGKNRVLKYASGSTTGVTVAGSATGASGVGLDFLNQPDGIDVDGLGNLYICDQNNNRLVMWPAGSTTGLKISGGKPTGLGANQFKYPSGLQIHKKTGDIYVADYLNFRAQKFVTSIVDTFDASQAGVYTVVMKAFNGCVITDSIAVYPALVTPTITIDSLKLGVSSSYDSYQWLKNDTIIPNATDSIYYVTENGDYRVIVNNNEVCIDTSNVYAITNIVGLEKMSELARNIQIYPNPANNDIYINSPVNVAVTILSIEGKVMIKAQDQAEISVANLAKGVYFLRITNNNGTVIKVEKLIKR